MVAKINRYKTRQVDGGFWKLLKAKALEEECTIMELQRRIAKANDIKLRDPVYKRTPDVEGRFKL